MKTSNNNNQNIESMRQQIATAISSNETIAKHVERIEIQEYCVYVYVDTRRASEKAMKQVQTSNRHLFAYVNYIKGKGVSVPYICYDLTGKAYNAIKREDKAEEKARREREALEAVEREKAEKQARKDAALKLSWEREDKGLPIGFGEFVLLRGIEGYVIGEDGNGCLVFRNEGDTWTETKPVSDFVRIMREKPEWVKAGQTVKFDGWLFDIETDNALGEDHYVFIRKAGEEPKCPKRYRKAVLFVRYEMLTPCTPDGRELLPEPPKEVVLQDTSEIKAVCIEGVSLTAEKRTKWVKNFGDIIREHTTQGRETQYNHDCGCIRVEVAYRNDSDKPEDMTYCVSWYKWLDIETEKRELVECENGIRLEQAARAMADFHLLADAGLTLQQILYPAA